MFIFLVLDGWCSRLIGVTVLSWDFPPHFFLWAWILRLIWPYTHDKILTHLWLLRFLRIPHDIILIFPLMCIWVPLLFYRDYRKIPPILCSFPIISYCQSICWLHIKLEITYIFIFIRLFLRRIQDSLAKTSIFPR